MPFDPTKPATGSPDSSAEMRAQLNGLHELIVPVGDAFVDGVTTLNPGEPATATVAFTAGDLHFTFAIPAGSPGETGPAGAGGGTGDTGAQGPVGPPFAQAIVDAVNTLDPGDPATVSVTFDGTNVRFTFAIPRGATGEVTQAALDAAIAGTARNPNTVAPLNLTADGTYNPTQLQSIADKLDELLAGALRT